MSGGRCTLCDLLKVAASDVEAALYHCALMSGRWGLDDFKTTMCSEHRARYVPALLRGAVALDAITGEPALAHKLAAEIEETGDAK